MSFAQNCPLSFNLMEMFRKILTVSILALIFCTSRAQTYHNEWIDYSKTYYKFKIGGFGQDIVDVPIKSGIVRIPQSALLSAGLAYIPVEQLQLWRNGEEIFLYTSKTSGILGAKDFIEFRGEVNDGKLDKELYRQPEFQITNYWSLQTDTASYFLTINPSGNNKRYQATQNNAATTSISAEKDFMYDTARYFRQEINPGLAAVSESINLYSSSYDRGEMWASRNIRPVNCGCRGGEQTLYIPFSPLYSDIAGPAMAVKVNAVGNGLNPRSAKVAINGDSIAQFKMDYFNTASINVSGIPVSKIQNDAAGFTFENLSTNPDDQMRIISMELTYPRLFNFGGSTSFEFSITASDNGRLLKIANFNYGSTLPVLYDYANGKRYVAVKGSADTIKFLLDPSTVDYKLLLARSDGSTAQTIASLQSKKFTNFLQSSNQGDYLIISNPKIYGSGSSNYIEQYRSYRSSNAGGGFNAKVIDINELVDQFAYGIKQHPLSVKNFLKYAKANFTEKPKFVFLLGKGMSYSDYRTNEADPIADATNLVPTWGYPGSDNLLCSDNFDPVSGTPVGRLSVVNANEVGIYLQKIKEFEAAQNDLAQTVNNKAWMKNVLQLTGAGDPDLGSILDGYDVEYKKIISDSLFGGNVTTFSKTADPTAYPNAVLSFKGIYEKGAGLIQYFGHSSQTSLDFSLSNPGDYNNAGKYPVFIVNGCLAGNIFNFETDRLNSKSTVSERFILEPERGAIGYLATSSYGVVPYLDAYTKNYYKAITLTKYGKSFGEISQQAISTTLQELGIYDFYTRIHGEQYTFHGDPALKLNSFNLPDYAVDSSEIIVPKYISVADDSFDVKVKIHNLGLARSDTFNVNFYRKFPAGDSVLIFSKTIGPIYSLDSLELKLPIISNRDKGVGYVTVFVDAENKINELSETNNVATTSFFITSQEIKPVSPYNYSIITSNHVKLSASTADALETSRQYIAEVDTTALFNSPLKQVIHVTSSGGVIEFGDLQLNLDSTVYYWRVAPDTTEPHWNMFSFTHIQGGNEGFMQAHYFQHTQSNMDGIMLDSTRRYQFAGKLSNIFVQQSIYPTSGNEDAQFSTSINGTYEAWSACIGSSIIFNVFDSVSLKAMSNPNQAFGSADNSCGPLRLNNFEFLSVTTEGRKNAMDFLNSVPDGYYVVVRKNYDLGNEDWAPTVWASDTALYGKGNSLYHLLKAQGFTDIDSFYYPRTFVFVFKKNRLNTFQPVWQFTNGIYDRVTLSVNVPSLDTLGYITSPIVGPGKKWNRFKWNGFSTDSSDRAFYQVIGMKKTGGADTLYNNVDINHKDVDISSVDAATYPYLQLRMKNSDAVNATPYQLQHWSVEFQSYPEGAIAPNLASNIPDWVHFNHAVNTSKDTLKGYVAFKNISTIDFTKSLKVKLLLYDSTGNQIEYAVPSVHALPAGDTVIISFAIDVSALEGRYNLSLDVNPDNDQPEQYTFNNFLYRYVTIDRRVTLPVKLVNFKAYPQGKYVNVKWSVAEESNINRYDVLYSTAGRNFASIGKVNATNTSGPHNYELLHNTPVTGKNYYRLKIVDKDGNIAYSNIDIVNFGASTVTLVYPNPFSQQLFVSVNRQDNGNSKVRLMNSVGQLILQQSFVNSTTLNVASLPAGMYLVQVDDGTQVKTFKVQKQH